MASMEQARILEELAKWHAAFLEPLPFEWYWSTCFAPGLSAAAHYWITELHLIVRPLQLSGSQSLVCSDSLDHLWDRLWSHHTMGYHHEHPPLVHN